MIYTYPKPQKMIRDSLFVMAAVFDSGKYTTYIIPYHNNNEIKYLQFDHAEIAEHLTIAPNDRATLSNFANGTPFIRLRLQLGKKYENI